MIKVLGKEYTKDQANDLVKKYFVWFLVAIYPTSVLFIKHSFSLAMLVMMICGSVILFRDRKEGNLSDHACEILFFKVGLAGLAVSTLSLVAGGRLLEISTSELEYFDKQLRFLFFVPFLILMKRTGIPEKIIWWGAVAAALSSGIYALALKIISPEIFRVSGGGNPISFGCFSVISAFVSLNGLIYFKKIRNSLVLLPVAAFFLGLTGSVLSGSRGAWLAIPVLSVITLINCKKFIKPVHTLIALISGLVAVFIISRSVDGSIIHNRLSETGSAVKKYFYGLDDLNTSADGGFISIGGRLEMYRVALDMIEHHPLLGVGPGRYHGKILEYIEAGKADKAIGIYQYPHNDYLTVATCNGIPGLVIFVLTAYLLPLYILYVYSGKDPSKPLFWVGVIFIAGYMIFSVSNSTLFKNIRLHYYYLLLAAISVALRSGRSEKGGKGN